VKLLRVEAGGDSEAFVNEALKDRERLAAALHKARQLLAEVVLVADAEEGYGDAFVAKLDEVRDFLAQMNVADPVEALVNAWKELAAAGRSPEVPRPCPHGRTLELCALCDVERRRGSAPSAPDGGAL
jgi:hypothetical protein